MPNWNIRAQQARRRGSQVSSAISDGVGVWKPRRVYITKNSPRRDRVIYKILQRSNRRWDLYATRVKSEKLSGEDGMKTQEWALIVENKELYQKIRKMDFITERNVRLENGRQTDGRRPFLPTRTGSVSDLGE